MKGGRRKGAGGWQRGRERLGGRERHREARIREAVRYQGGRVMIREVERQESNGEGREEIWEAIKKPERQFERQ